MRDDIRPERARGSGEALPPREEEIAVQEKACRALVSSFDTLLLSTLDQEGAPELSYAPFVEGADGVFWIYISALAAHTRNLRKDARCAVLFIRDERQSRNLFARERLSLQCRAEIEDVKGAAGAAMVKALEARHGETVSLLRSLPDFQLFRLTPKQGRYVVGFGRAFEWQPGGALQAIGPPGSVS
ncbi:HugZ family protein [Motiliproteus sp. SC1-56]|uniref:HugZ family pyridoxamine 5'-phosphate oxidase n=1 Tax=Motiliproteus sp. SC1-56 TaxID=2799565 RepID=UPI001A8FE639|nr:pyridoxamine 5'-phosphate oxidase family protein [Motiliproteus sp. SC1-56]